MVSGLRSERLFFEPGATNSILEEAKKTTTSFDKECVVMDSFDPVLDFRASMEEMVEANHGDRIINNWEFLEELLTCYLRVNQRRHHVYIVEAFADLLIHLSFNNKDDDVEEKPRCSFTSPLSFTSSPSPSPPEKSLQEN